MAQYARPDSDVAAGGWATAPLYQKIDETPYSDSDYITDTFIGGAGTAVTVGLSNVGDPGVSSGHIIRVRFRVDDIVSGSWTVTVRLYEGATTRSTDNATANTSFTTSTFTLSTAEANSITDYTNLRIEVEFYNDDEFGTYTADISWIEFEVPDAATTVYVYDGSNWKQAVADGVSVYDGSSWQSQETQGVWVYDGSNWKQVVS